MALLNDGKSYGALTKLLHWLMVALFAFQYVAAAIMVRLDETGKVAGLGQSDYYNWHKSIGLVALAVAIVRIVNRRSGRLPDWAPTLSAGEKTFIHRAEQVLYTAMVVMPISGFVYVMAGGYGVRLFGVYDLANPIGVSGPLAALGKWVHVGAAYVLLAAIAGHVGLVLRHQLIMRDGLLRRMLPGQCPPNTTPDKS